jgi:hypothetical protein
VPDYGSSERKPELAEVLARAKSNSRVDLHTGIPAVVTRYDPTKRLVDVQPLIKVPYLDEGDARQVQSMAMVTNCPIKWPGGGGHVLTFPISDGKTTVIEGAIPPATTGWLYFAERSIDKWLSGRGGEVDPEIDHDHHESDGVFEPELRTFGASYPTTPADHAVLGWDGGPQIHLRKATICIGDEAGSKPIGLDQDTVDCGTLTAVIVQAGPTVTVTLNYTPPGGVLTQVLTFSATGTGSPGTYPVPLSGKLHASATQGKAK